MQCLRKKIVMRVLLSIKPEFVQKIFSGEKRFEFRKAIFKNKEVKNVVVYASKPIAKIVGEFTVETVLEDSPETIWKITKNYAGITEEFLSNILRAKIKPTQ